MAAITKDTIAEVLGITDSDDIQDSVYTWALKQFYTLTGLEAAEIQKTHRQFITNVTNYIKLPDKNIKQIDTITVDGSEKEFSLHTSLKFNPDTGLLYFTGGFGYTGAKTLEGEPYIGKCTPYGSFSGGQLVEVTYTVNAYAHKDIHDYLISLLVAKAMSLFTPDKINQVKSVKIGNFSKSFGGSSSSLETYQESLNTEIERVIDLISGDDGQLTVGRIA